TGAVGSRPWIEYAAPRRRHACGGETGQPRQRPRRRSGQHNLHILCAIAQMPAMIEAEYASLCTLPPVLFFRKKIPRKEPKPVISPGLTRAHADPSSVILVAE